MRTRSLRFSSLGFVLLLFTGTAVVIGQGNRDERRRHDFSPIDLPGGSRVEFLTIESSALNGMGELSVFFPPSYRSGNRDYPVVYFLHGMFNDHTSWTVTRYGNLPEQIETLMIEGKLPEMLLVHPNGGRSFYTNYHDNSLKYEDFVVKEIPAHIESRYRVKKNRSNRALAGTSMGGYGALKIALKYPDSYAAAAAHSPIIFPVRNPMEVPPQVMSSRRFRFFSEIFASVYGDPFDQAYYDANNPLVLAQDASKNLNLYFDYGTADRYNELVQLGKGLRELDRKLSQAGVSHTFREHPGEPHGWALVVAHIEDSLGFVSRSFDTE